MNPLTGSVYYDTNAFGYFFLKHDVTHEYSPFSTKYVNLASPFSIEEFFFTFISRSKWGNLFPYNVADRIKKLEEFLAYMSNFEVKQVDLQLLSNLFITLALQGLDAKMIHQRGGFDFYDLLHLSYSLLIGADTFITSDHAFDKIEHIFGDIVKSYKLRKIVIYGDNTFIKKFRTIFLISKI